VPSERPTVRPSDGFGRGGRGALLGDQPPAGVDQATWDKARAACASLRPSGRPSGFGGNNTAFAAYRNCLSEHGVSPSTGPNQLNTADPQVAAAMKVCAPLRPSPRPRPSQSG
jgi:hypothetical protein